MVRELLMTALQKAVDGEYQSVVVVAETTDEGYDVMRTHLDNQMAVGGFFTIFANDLLAESFYGPMQEGEEEDDKQKK
jgi:hypothetical protein